MAKTVIILLACFIGSGNAVLTALLQKVFKYDFPEDKEFFAGPCGRPPLSPIAMLIRPDASDDQYTLMKDVIMTRRSQVDLASTMPWVITIQYASMDDKEAYYSGAAVLIRVRSGYEKSDIALTSRITCDTIHSWALMGRGVRAVFGQSGDHPEGHTVVPVVDCVPFLDEDFKSDKAYDIAVIKLQWAVPFNDNIRPVCTPKADEIITAGTRGFIAQWDNDYFTQNKTFAVSKRTAQVVDQQSCSGEHIWNLTDKVVCVGVYDKGRNETEFDVNGIGGPFFTSNNVTYEVTAILGGLFKKLPNLLPRVSYYIRGRFIQEQIYQLSSLWKWRYLAQQWIA